MDSLAKLDGILTMSSLEIAELTGKEHKNVMVDIREMIKSLNKAVADFSATAFYEVNNAKRKREIFNLPKRETLILVSGYSVAMRAKIIDRWQALEALQAPKFQVPTTLAGALRLAAEQAETIEKQTTQIEQQKPAVEFVDQYVKTDSSKTISEVAKLLKAGQKMFFAWLDIEGIIFKRGDTWLPKARYAKYFDVKTGLTLSKNPKNFNQTRFTPAGVVWIAKKWDAFNNQGKLL